MNNIKQLTNFDIQNATEVRKRILKGGDLGEEIPYPPGYPYLTITQAMLGAPIFKMGYCCEVKGINYPIFLTVNNIEHEFQIGKTGMFEFQPETWKDINVSEEEYETNIKVTQILVPKDIKFVLDYTYEV